MLKGIFPLTSAFDISDNNPLHIQHRELTSTSKVEVQYDKNELTPIKITKIAEDLAAAPPSFSILYFEIHTTSSSYIWALTMSMTRSQRLDPDISKNQKSHLRAASVVFSNFSEYVLVKDPDIVISSTQLSRSSIIRECLFARINDLGLGAYDSKENFRYLYDNNIEAVLSYGLCKFFGAEKN